MEYIKNSDYEYISNKYHDTNKPFDTFARFIRHDEIFSPETGIHGDDIISGIVEQDESIKHISHPVRKAEALSFVLKNTRISCDSRDRYPAINSIDRPLNRTLLTPWKKELFEEIIPEVGKKRDYFENAGIVTMWPDFDHSVPDWDRIFTLGFEGLLNDSERARKSKKHTAEEEDFFEGIRITYTAIVDFVGRLADLASKTPGSERMAKALSHIQHNPPSTFYEALLVDYLFFMICEHIENQQVRSLCNFDRIFYPYYAKDLENGVSEEELRTDLAYFFMQFTAIGNYWGQPVYLGGVKADGEPETNELSYMFLDVYDKMKIYNPKVQLKISHNTPKDFVLKALDMIRHGHNSIVLVCEETVRKALIQSGATEEQARTADIKGCYEYAIRDSVETSMNYTNLLNPLEYALHEGCDGVTGEFAVKKCPHPDAYATFEEFYEEYKNQLGCIIDIVINTVNSYEDYLSFISPQSVLSATYSSCLEKAQDALCGGGIMNDTSLCMGFLADAADSLTAVKKYVFDKQVLTLAQFRDILDANYRGHEDFRRVLLADPDKYGNNRDLPDSIAKDIAEFVVNYSKDRPNAKKRGGKWECGFHVARMSYVQGAKTAASPNGRLKGEELSKNLSASMGQNKEGATAAILSVTKIDASSFCGDASLDLGLLPSAVKGSDGLEAMYGLVKTFFKRGGHAVHINVFDADTLRNAQKNPEKYQDLQIRVCGWNVLWNNITKEEQDGFIRQAEALV